jgi:transmembrane sensor
MNQLGRPREAELAYGRARTLAPGGSLSQDALARQVEAAHRAGDQDHARVLAVEYETLYPQGRRLNAVRRFGGLP